MLPPVGRPGSGADLPVREVLDELTAALADRGTALLVAPPGTGKTTLVPLALADGLPDGAGRVVVAEPRRVAVRAAARRMASLVGEPVGQRVGWSVRGERRTSAATRVEVVTTGLLLRRLQRDPELPGVAVVVLDEVHERHLDADLALALLLDARAALRPDLRVLAASATPDTARLAAVLGSSTGEDDDDGARPAPVVVATAPVHPLEVVWAPPTRPVRPPEGTRTDPALLDHVAATTRRALAERDGDVLVFVPGAAEVGGVRSRLERSLSGGSDGGAVDVLALSGRQSTDAQDAALRPSEPGRRRVVVSTAVAESSLTVPGVRTVVDAGLARVPRTDHARGLGGLATVRVSRAAAEQRAGRAAREAPGAVYRCWSALEHERLAPQPQPEVATADLTGAVLALATWSRADGAGLPLLDPLPAGATAAAARVLHDLGLLDDDDPAAARPTPRGLAVASLGLEPRWGRALLDGAALVGERTAAEVVALLSEDGLVGGGGPGGGGPGGGGDDVAASWRALRRDDDPGRSARWRAEVRRLAGALADLPPGQRAPAAVRAARLTDDAAAALVVGLAHPERLARARPAGSAGSAEESYLTTGGTAVRLAPGSALRGAPWLAVAVADRSGSDPEARVRAAAALDEDGARAAAPQLLAEVEEVAWQGGAGGDVVARRVERLGAVELSSRPLTGSLDDRQRALVARALADGLAQAGLALLPWSEGAVRLRQRLAACRAALGDPWPAVDDDALLARAAEWLGPELAAARRRADLARVDTTSALRRLLPWPEAARLDELAPERLPLPAGGKQRGPDQGSARLDWSDPAAPVLAVRLQQVLGWTGAPRVLDGRVAVVVHLLSPAGRPLAVTADLAGFWRGAYREVRAQMRGRYPKHAWPEDPLTPP
ncbi:ATP-dependent helicase HrpB [Quadrisphaera oryzae]|uniref:ATP-dependent helicase HrpB n=1 Tax=Quadrisphaera TaxID=317661 RepID=UPI001644CF44|nr:ATP-dependent helicase HrpB [Quadrisphaera sp. RL12-1S]MBC3763692.1 ATP-dependent helicase HrpB [Quadrisphaera sp. RL12-1S]